MTIVLEELGLGEIQSEGWETLGWIPSDRQLQIFNVLYEQILAGNQRLNLTRITDPVGFWEKHLWDSLRGVAPWLSGDKLPLRVIDIGTGAGFPGIPIAIAIPQAEVTLLDSTGKKIAFLQALVPRLGLENAIPYLGRVEAIAQQSDHRQTYDLVVLRAVAAATVAAEYSLPLLKIGGVAVLYRGQWTPQEQQDLENAIAPLGGKLDSVEAFVTPVTESVRHCVYLRKIKPTPDRFPRPVGIPTQKPLGSPESNS
ncbi:16S rRNA (guanine(527)-N(7))-methyltransferase RsmG [Arthrospira platensis]|uniref:16S rRNA (guanine(527)-N(7))-methyltransferase RsmG n=1 Tax=Limnospira TaxID=2596745 RepID=UPI00029201CA|nr:16S rRNA (guanine(527)-N(7))-methyltransferase RsmG [Arthrospira platensis YZ]KDR56335.1 16S rRNA methyltransferase [Arthrospira platensis str. Paraca]MBD2571496.1 16S rRNA (guanine(527)-N(7))-methyltransferase RsmG [Arthrospira platensis FACHB-971]MBD2667585.1 16S rRNA (guanine(527)-N(7))-methyltransferase RsmG [Arthrospira platensis FACHB-439]MBD2708815.1 16S rRNA (guanine(527)-N(7))-methyltransferase RsmG [Arthrospira platensis FACHB-835]MDT9308881.1 16S rRNA (guanine(527)-N(7))-methyltr